MGTAGFFAGRLSVTDFSMVELVEPEYRMKVAELEEWSVGPRPALSKAEWRQRYGDDVTMAARRVIAGLSATSYPDIEAIYNAYQFARHLSIEQIEQALAEAEQASRPEAALAMEAALLNQWAALDGEGALTYALGRNDYHREALVHASVTGWVRHDPAAACDWYREEAESVWTNPYSYLVLDGIVYGGLARTDMPAALAGVGKLPSARRDQVLEAIAGQVYHDPAKRAEFLERLGGENGELLRSAQQAVIARWSRHDPVAAAKFLDDLDVSEEEREGLDAQLMATWSDADPRAALEWQVGRAAELEQRQRVLEDYFSIWLTEDEAAASEWLADQPEELQTDRVFEISAFSLAVTRPVRAMAWAEQILDGKVREEVMMEVFAGWQADDAAGAEAWLDSQEADTQTLFAAAAATEGATTSSADAIAALQEELRALEQATGLTPDEIAAKREELELLLNAFATDEAAPVGTGGIAE